MNWDNVFKMLDTYTQYRHYQILFDKYKLQKKVSRDEMAKVLHEAVTDAGFLGTVMSESALEEWLALHQIDGNNYTYVYNLQEKIDTQVLADLYNERRTLVNMKLWDINPENDSENINEVMTNLNDITLTGIHRNDTSGSYTFSFVSPCEVTGSRDDGSNRIYKKVFFSHFVCFDNSNDCKIIFNPTSNLINVNGVRKEKRYDWTPIANMVFEKVKEYIGEIHIKAPSWIPQALYQFAEEATSHKNPEITAASFNAQFSIVDFATELLKNAEVDTDNEPALVSRLIQDIQLSFEAQLLEIYGPNEEENSFTIFKQRSDGVTHIISVESTEEGFKSGPAAQAAKRSRQDGDIDLLGVNLKKDERVHKFLVEQGTDAYLIRGTNTFIEEEVVNIVIRRLNEYRKQIQVATSHSTENSERTSITQAE
ncbi:hypothetical protein COM59_24170 [Bacillus pseudomycoides]|uniref:hypothetical protein n=1 Tax=Bacillus pseudomycoides TaxID=64104 RepID=UPI000BF40FF9|nr:hypothetical protein [Bacillus pseudomycoides]PGF06480.1 hypothetical protein COM59_24170 [Bacillus pseudomycoides]